MVVFRSKVFKAVAFGASAATGLGYYVINKISAEEKVLDSRLVKIKRDTISAIPNVFEGQVDGDYAKSLVQATRASRDLSQQTLTINGYPGLVVGVSLKGEPVWVQGFGFSNVESGSRCTKDTVMRIASISKPLTMAAVAKLVEEGKIDIDRNIYDYLDGKFPVKKVDGQKVTMTIRQLASHLGGIRHYIDDGESRKLFKFYRKAIDAIEIFANDDLLAKPGTKFHYSTFGYTLIAAAVESVLPKDKSFGEYLVNDICRKNMGMNNTYLDENPPLITNRAKQYCREHGRLKNAPFVDCSYKYAGGGLLSTVPDLLRFGNVMLYSFLPNRNGQNGFLKKETVDELWTPAPMNAKIQIHPNMFDWSAYGLGWGLIRNAEPKCTSGAVPPFKDIIFHTGSATGGTTLLAIVPEKELVVALICNIKNARELMTLGVGIIELFGNVDSNSSVIVKNHKEIVPKSA